jgi:hypothetical protein
VFSSDMVRFFPHGFADPQYIGPYPLAANMQQAVIFAAILHRQYTFLCNWNKIKYQWCVFMLLQFCKPKKEPVLF